MSTSTVNRHRKAQKESGRRLLTTWVKPETQERLRALARGGSIGAVLDRTFQEPQDDNAVVACKNLDSM